MGTPSRHGSGGIGARPRSSSIGPKGSSPGNGRTWVEAEQTLVGDSSLLGYFIAMKGVDEVHLLNLTVAPEHQRQGWARVLLDALALWSRGQGAQCAEVVHAQPQNADGARLDDLPSGGVGAWMKALHNGENLRPTIRRSCFDAATRHHGRTG